MRLHLVSAQLHKWIGLIIGIQILLWISGGFIMSFFPIEKVRGEHNVREAEALAITPDRLGVTIPFVLEQLELTSVRDVRIRPVLDRLVYEIRPLDGAPIIVDAKNGEILSPIGKEMAETIAKQDFSGDGALTSISLLDKGNAEYRGPVPVWRVEFNDSDNTHLYVSPDLGRIVARRNGTWRLYDFFWMLHIMDYQERENFNNKLVVSAAAIAFIFVITGFMMLFFRLRKRDAKIVKSLVTNKLGRRGQS